MFAQSFVWYMEFSEYIDRVSIFGREDGSSWRGRNGATHFDRNYDPKLALWAIVDPVAWLEGETETPETDGTLPQAGIVALGVALVSAGAGVYAYSKFKTRKK